MDGTRTIEIEANGIRFSAYEAGEGPLVLCLHGFPDHARSFRHQVGPLVEAGHRVVVPYMRGYAPTSAPEDGCYQLAALAHDAVGLIDALDEERGVIFGHDWGAITAYAAAALAPERVSRLVTAAVPYGPAFLEKFATSYEQLKRSWYIFVFQQPVAEIAVLQDNGAFIAKLWRDWSPTWDAPTDEVDAVCELLVKPDVLTAALGYYRAMFNAALHRADLADDEAKMNVTPIQVPTMYLHGRDDGCMGVELAQGMEAMFPAGLDKHVIAGAGHFLHQEKPDEINRLVLDFLTRG
ncbi:MAG: alpha/beta hydrolase [Myxococcales bacterium]|jgi:pimeloyl-ACP methyl ester carboxylesterase|nr:MAG: alpha/beta hydrolase [Myxococcales bacterium]